MQHDIDNLVMWLEKWQLPFIVFKCTTLHLGKTSCSHVYIMAGCDIKQASEEKDWQSAKFHKHIAVTVSKARNFWEWLISALLT